MWGLLVTCLASQPCTDEVIDVYPTRDECVILQPDYASRNPQCLEVSAVIDKDGDVLIPK